MYSIKIGNCNVCGSKPRIRERANGSGIRISCDCGRGTRYYGTLQTALREWKMINRDEPPDG